MSEKVMSEIKPSRMMNQKTQRGKVKNYEENPRRAVKPYKRNKHKDKQIVYKHLEDNQEVKNWLLEFEEDW